MPNPKGPRLGQVGRRSLRLANPPPGGFAPTPHHLRESAKLRQQEEQEEQRHAGELRLFERFALVIGLVLVVVIAVFVTIVVASHQPRRGERSGIRCVGGVSWTGRRYVLVCRLSGRLALVAEGASWRTNPLGWGSVAHEAPRAVGAGAPQPPGGRSGLGEPRDARRALDHIGRFGHAANSP